MEQLVIQGVQPSALLNVEAGAVVVTVTFPFTDTLLPLACVLLARAVEF
jgi:hypothetical protein